MGRGGGRAGRRGGQELEFVYRCTRHLPAAEPTHNTRVPPPRCPWTGRHVKDEHVKGVAQDVAEGAAEDLAFGARAARALLATPLPPPPPSLCSSR